MDWLEISSQKGLSEEFIIEHQVNLHWDILSFSQHLSENMIEKFVQHVDWRIIAERQDISLEFVKKHKSKLPLWLVKRNKYLISYEKEIDTIYKEQNETMGNIDQLLDSVLEGLS